MKTKTLGIVIVAAVVVVAAVLVVGDAQLVRYGVGLRI